MRLVYGLLLGMSGVGVMGLGWTFVAQGRPDLAGWHWSPEVYAQWQFFDLAWEGEHLLFALTLETQGWRTPPPSALGVTLTFSSFGCWARTLTVSLKRVAVQGPFVRYFGQVSLARRDLGFGSYLIVSLRTRVSSAEVGVHAQSLDLVGAPPARTGAVNIGGPSSPGPAFPGAASPAAYPVPPSAPQPGLKSIRECSGPEDAPYLAPGSYLGELGWPGPGAALDAQDWFRVNLAPGQLLELRIQTPAALAIHIFNSSGQAVGRLEGRGRLGLMYEAQERGPYYICIAILESSPTFTYALDLSLRR